MSLKLSLLQAEKPHLSQPVLIKEVLQPFDHLCGLPLQALQKVHVLPLLGPPDLNAIFQVGSQENSKWGESPHSTSWSHFFWADHLVLLVILYMSKHNLWEDLFHCLDRNRDETYRLVVPWVFLHSLFKNWVFFLFYMVETSLNCHKFSNSSLPLY